LKKKQGPVELDQDGELIAQEGNC